MTFLKLFPYEFIVHIKKKKFLIKLNCQILQDYGLNWQKNSSEKPFLSVSFPSLFLNLMGLTYWGCKVNSGVPPKDVFLFSHMLLLLDAWNSFFGNDV